jgi:hypothetical protein
MALMACSQTIKLKPFAQEPDLYQPMFVDFDVNKQFTNPFDQDEVKTDAIIVSANKDTVTLPCFFTQNSNTGWQARFTPRKAGEYSLQIRVTTKNGSELSDIKKFKVSEKAKGKGLLSLDKENPFFMKFDNGEKFRGIGLNVGWEYEPKWDTKAKYTYNGMLSEMAKNNANYFRTWICPWNMPIDWSPVKIYEMVTDEFADFSKTVSHSAGLNISLGKTPFTQADENQLIKASKESEEIVYKLDSVRNVKIMIYHTGKIEKSDIEIFYSNDGSTYNKAVTEFSESWDATDKWKRVFLFTFEEISQPAQYVKVVFGKNVGPDNVKIAGIQFKYGKKVSEFDSKGVSHFSKKNSEKLDSLIQLCDSKGMYILLTLGYHGIFNPKMDSWGANDEWQRNPYNKKNGGPCATPAEFFSNKEAIHHYKNFLRYMIARYGYSPVISVWEFWNEGDIAQRSQNVPLADYIAWHKEMADYMHVTDPYHKPVTTSLSWGDNKELWAINSIDLTQVHRYSPSKDFYAQTLQYIADNNNKPHVMGEYAIGWKGPGNDYSDEMYEENFHDGLWQGLFTPVTILPLSWWWDYHFDKNQYTHFAAVATVTEMMKQSNDVFKPLSIKKIDGFDILAVSTSDQSIVWIKKTATKTIANVDIPVNQDKTYKIEILNTWTNKVEKQLEIASANKVLKVSAIDLSAVKDVVLIVK